MEALYDRVLELVRALRDSGRAEAADGLLAAMTQACSPREILMELRYAAADLDVEALTPELRSGRAALLEEVERQWQGLA